MTDETGKAPCPNLRKAILAAQRKVGTIHKSHKAEIRGKDNKIKFVYMFAGGEDVMEHGCAALHEQGVSWEIVGFEPWAGPGGQWLKLSVELFHEASEELEGRVYHMPVTGFGDADKVFSGTITYCKGYAMAALLAIPRRDDKGGQGADHRDREVGNERPTGQRSLEQPPVDRLNAIVGKLANMLKMSTPDAFRLVEHAADISPGRKPTDAQVVTLIGAAERLLAAPEGAADGRPVVGLDRWTLAAKAHRDYRVADFTKAEGDPPSDALKKRFASNVISISARAVGNKTFYPNKATEGQLEAATLAIGEDLERLKAAGKGGA